MRPAGPRDAVVTGAGLVTAFGGGLAATFEALAQGRTAVGPTGDAPADSGRGRAARAEPPFLRAPVPREMEAQIKFLNGSGELAVEATIEAAAAADLASSGVAAEMRGLYLSQMDSDDWLCHEFRPAVLAATDSFAKELEAEALNRAAARRMKPFFMLESLKNNAFSFLATMFELRGANTSVAGFAGPTLELVDLGVRSLARGSLDTAVVVGAARPCSPVARIEMAERGITPAGADGLAPGDGAAALVLERREDADARGASPLAAVLGRATCTRPPEAGAWTPRAETLAEAAAAALAEAEIGPGDLLGIVVPDVGEAGLDEAIEALPAARGAARAGWKRATGHMALASDAADAALAARAVAQRRLPGGGGNTGSAVLVLTAGLLGQAGALVLGPA